MESGVDPNLSTALTKPVCSISPRGSTYAATSPGRGNTDHPLITVGTKELCDVDVVAGGGDVRASGANTRP
jgi:hypothetical protein